MYLHVNMCVRLIWKDCCQCALVCAVGQLWQPVSAGNSSKPFYKCKQTLGKALLSYFVESTLNVLLKEAK